MWLDTIQFISNWKTQWYDCDSVILSCNIDFNHKIKSTSIQLGIQYVSENNLENLDRDVSSWNVVIENLGDTNEMLQA